MDITPHVNLLKSLRGERINYRLLVAEALDNALDAGAKRIDVSIGDHEIQFCDDGAGITRDRIRSLFTIGEHGQMATTQLGRFGIGIKNQAVNAGNILGIDSISSDGRVRARVDWRDLLRSGGSQWQIDDPQWLPTAIDAPTRTTITIGALRKAPPIRMDTLSADIAQQFHPALVSNRQISLNGSFIEPVIDPQLTDIIEQQFSLSDGRSAHLRAGILVRPSKLRRVHVSYRHRVIMPNSSLGCADYGGINKMFARVQLSGPWHLARYKDDLTDEAERDELEETISEALEPILEKCSSASLEARIDQISSLINEFIPQELAAARPKRQKEKTERAGDKKKRNTRGYVAPEKSDPDGPAKTKRAPQDRLLITFDGIAEEHGVGEFQPGRPHRVNLSRDDSYIADLLELRDQEICARSLYALALAIFEEGRHRHNPELPLWGEFGKRISRLLDNQNDPAKVSAESA